MTLYLTRSQSLINSFRIKEKVLAKKDKVLYTVIGKNKHAIGILVSAKRFVRTMKIAEAKTKGDLK